MAESGFIVPELFKDEKLIAIGNYIKNKLNERIKSIDPTLVAVVSIQIGTKLNTSSLQYPVLYVNRLSTRASQKQNIRYSDILIVYGLTLPSPAKYEGILNWISYQLTEILIEWREEEDCINPMDRNIAQSINYSYNILQNVQSGEFLDTVSTTFQIKES
jgi:hypothetical protein